MNIKLEGITKNYGSHCVLNAFSAEFSDGVYGLLGPNGAGKSTLINILVGLPKRTPYEHHKNAINRRSYYKIVRPHF